MREVTALRELIDLARQLPARSALVDRFEQRAQLIASVESLPAHVHREHAIGIPSSRVLRAALMGAALAVAGVAALVVVRALEQAPSAHVPGPATHAELPAPIHRASVEAVSGTAYALVGAQPDERVRLRDGSILVTVAPLHIGERFRVVTGDAVVEVRGTEFGVIVAEDRLVAVTVRHGRVEVRHADEPLVVLGAGERWDAAPLRDIVSTSKAPAQPAMAHPTRSHVIDHALPQPILPTAVPATGDGAFQDGIAALQSNHMTTAVAAFERSLAQSPRGALAEDSQFWLAVARGRAGQRTSAIGAFEDFLSLYPHSVRAGKASAMLGWLLVDAHDLVDAQRRFEAARNDPADDVRASAAAGLELIAPAQP